MMSSQKSSSKGQGICRMFGKPGGCRFGPRCKFVHEAPNAGHRVDPLQYAVRPSNPFVLSQAERSRFNHWLYQTPEALPQVGLGTKLSAWIKAAETFVASENVEVRQQVIERLSTEGGFTRTVEVLVAAPPMPVDIARGQQYLIELAQPLLSILANTEVARSLLLEPAVDRIHNLLYGTGGLRALAFFMTLSDVISVQQDMIATRLDVIADALTVLHRTAELNGAAKVVPGYQELVEKFSRILSHTENIQTARAIKARSTLRRIAGIMEIGSLIPQAEDVAKPINEHLAVFELTRELPGALRDEGPRHDNDHIDIANIAIMPTKNELEAHEADYLPVNDPKRLHLPGLEGLLDRHFRLLREDSVGQLRDAVRFELQQLRHALGLQPVAQREQRGTRVMVYRDVVLDDLVLGKDYLAIRLSFRLPEALSSKSKGERRTWWESSRSLMEDSLVCLLGPDGFAAFGSVCHDPKKPGGLQGQGYPRDFSENELRASTFLNLVEPYSLSFRRVDACFNAGKRQALVLCEFPGILLPAFYHTLDGLKVLSQKLDTPFAQLLAPEHTAERICSVEPPLYATVPGFKFDLRPLIDDKDTLELVVGRRFNYELLQKHSTLDDGQQRAIIDALTKQFALIQGPPGYGKSFTGVALIKTLLANKKKARLGPIICVCYTNHALDQLLEHLVKQNVKQVVRIGGQSKSEILKEVNLRDLARAVDETSTERRRRGQLHGALQSLTSEIESELVSLRSAGSWETVSSYLNNENEAHLLQLQSLEHGQVDREGFQTIDYDRRPPLEKWLSPRHGAPPQARVVRSSEQLQMVALEQMTLPERRHLYGFWQDAIRLKHKTLLVEHLKDYSESRKKQQACFREKHLRCLAQADVVGLTTSGLAKNFDMLRRLSAKVLVCEEAGEVLEAHLLTALLPTIEHAILIGDHEQLRPQIQNYELQSSNPRGERFSLDISLFERLINPPFDHMPELPYSTLNRQRRMHPSISNLIRETLYPDLQDDQAVLHYPAVSGMSQRLFWLDHQHPEESKDHSKSYSNNFEIEMVAALVSHLIAQCQYQTEDIAVLTPYLGQLRKLRSKLGDLYDIVLDDRDQAELQKQGGVEQDVAESRTQAVARASLLRVLRLATVDNFQGEEAKVVVISLVRSNEQKKCGFLRTTNRTNVLLSRAQHGMYLIGDAACYESQPMWEKVIQMLRDDGSFGSALELQCAKHPRTHISVATADDFMRFSPEGGCSMPCEDRLSCGHQCPNKCHAKARHDMVFCHEVCLRPRAGCDHLCSKACSAHCGLCEELVEDVALPCGHVSLSEKCYVSQNTALAMCQVSVEREIPGCHHRIYLPCHVKLDDSTACTALCDSQLSCHHTCKRRCHECRRRREGSSIAVNHGKCQAECGNRYSLCGHLCKQLCHRGQSNCKPCQAKCQTRCRHSQCPKTCSEPCAPCAEPCLAGCEHTDVCRLPCAVPCDLVPCSRRCQRVLACVCQCSSVCGEICPDRRYCRNCCDNDVREKIVDYIENTPYADVDLDHDPCYILPCGHILAMSMLDGMMSMSKYYEMDQDGQVTALKGQSIPFTAEVVQCPECRHPVQNLQRYNRIWRRAFLDESTKKFIAWSTSEFVPLSEGIDRLEQSLAEHDKLSVSTQDARGTQDLPSRVQQLELAGNFDNVIGTLRSVTELARRYYSILRHRKRLKQYLRQVTEGEQPIGRVRDMLKSMRLQRGESTALTTSALPDHIVLQSKQRLLATSLSLRCDLVILTDFFAVRRANAQTFTDKYDWRALAVSISFNEIYEACKDLAFEAQSSSHPMIHVEAQLFFARLVSLERSNSGSASSAAAAMEDRVQQAHQYLEIARDACKAYPAQTPGMLTEVEAAAQALREDTFYQPVTNEEKRQIIAAMRTEFSVSGHWYYCPNGHPFTIGECGRAMQESTCPECGAAVGGGSHRLVEGNRSADDITREFGNLRV